MLEAHADPEQAAPMAKYMRGQFPFLGIKTPRRKKLFKEFLKEHGQSDVAEIDQVLRELWQLPEREYQYCGVSLLRRMQKKLPPEFVTTLKHLIVTKSWWDTVDALAAHPVGTHFARYPQVREATLPRWRAADNFWLRRTTLLFQLNYKDETDRDLLFALCRENANSDEFFIQKAIGWALRQYSKTNATAVIAFVEETPLPVLSQREALKWLKAQGRLSE